MSCQAGRARVMWALTSHLTSILGGTAVVLIFWNSTVPHTVPPGRGLLSTTDGNLKLKSISSWMSYPHTVLGGRRKEDLALWLLDGKCEAHDKEAFLAIWCWVHIVPVPSL